MKWRPAKWRQQIPSADTNEGFDRKCEHLRVGSIDDDLRWGVTTCENLGASTKGRIVVCTGIDLAHNKVKHFAFLCHLRVAAEKLFIVELKVDIRSYRT